MFFSAQIPHLSQCLWECRKIDSETLQQCVACSFGNNQIISRLTTNALLPGIIFKKFSSTLGATKGDILWIQFEFTN
jgi:hypothetical protein